MDSDCSTPSMNTLISKPFNAVGFPLISLTVLPFESTPPKVVCPATAVYSY